MMHPTNRSPKKQQQTQTHGSSHHGSHHSPHVSDDQLQLLDETSDQSSNLADEWALTPATRCVGLAGVKEARQYLALKAKLPIAKASQIVPVRQQLTNR
jgi:hypothetical protein